MELEVDRLGTPLSTRTILHDEGQANPIAGLAPRDIRLSADRHDGRPLAKPVQVRIDSMVPPEPAQIRFILDPDAQILPYGSDHFAMHSEPGHLGHWRAELRGPIRTIYLCGRSRRDVPVWVARLAATGLGDHNQGRDDRGGRAD